MIINLSRHLLIGVGALLFLLTACATNSALKTAQTKIVQAQQTIPEEELLDVGITVFKSAELTEKKEKQEGTNPDVRNAENHYVPYHLKNTLEQSGHWGMVRVTPLTSNAADVLVTGEILESNGENLTLKITVADSSGRVWLEKKYKATLTDTAYKDNVPGQKDPFQGIYNNIANDMAHHMGELSPSQIKEIRTISKLRFAQDFAPEVFNPYLQKDKEGNYTINRLPADDDTMMERLLRIREREYMFEDTINEYYEGFYAEMWPPYENWRQLNLTERIALAEQKRSALLRKVGGILMIAAAIAMQTQGVHDSILLTGGLVVAGGQVFLSGVNISKQAKMNYEALQELGESFGKEMKPIVMEFEGKKYELQGSAEEQYKRWQELLREIYYAETGFAPTDVPPAQNP
jgi:hypothetical protein